MGCQARGRKVRIIHHCETLYPCKTLTLTPSTHVIRTLDKSQSLRYSFYHTRIFEYHETALTRGKYERLRAQRAGGWCKPVASILRSSLASCVGETVLGLQWRESVRSLRRELPLQSAGVLALDKAALVRARQNKVVPRKRFSASFRPCQGGGRSFWSSARIRRGNGARLLCIATRRTV